jgi:hypothetical protein
MTLPTTFEDALSASAAAKPEGMIEHMTEARGGDSRVDVDGGWRAQECLALP